MKKYSPVTWKHKQELKQGQLMLIDWKTNVIDKILTKRKTVNYSLEFSYLNEVTSDVLAVVDMNIKR